METWAIWQPLISMQQLFPEGLHSPKNYPLPNTTDKIIYQSVYSRRKEDDRRVYVRFYFNQYCVELKWSFSFTHQAPFEL